MRAARRRQYATAAAQLLPSSRLPLLGPAILSPLPSNAGTSV